jgi:hypothetical protein
MLPPTAAGLAPEIRLQMTAATGRFLARQRAEKVKADDDQKLIAIRARLALAHARRGAALKQTVVSCRRARLRVRELVKALRLRARARLALEVAELRGQARNRCQARKHRIRAAGGSLRAKERAHLREERRYQAQLKRLAAAATRKRARLAASSKERRQESDDYVRGNLPNDLRSVFEKVKRQIKGGPRTTRTEAFLEWAESHPDEVLHHQSNEADAEVRRLVAEHNKLRPPRKGRRSDDLLEAVPF